MDLLEEVIQLAQHHPIFLAWTWIGHTPLGSLFISDFLLLTSWVFGLSII
jgi:hypothetical protein